MYIIKKYFSYIILVIYTISICSCVSTSNNINVTSTPPVELPTSTETQESISGGDVYEAVSTDAKSFQIYLTTDITSRDFQFKVYASGLWQRDPNTNLPIPYMADSWTVSSDGKTYTFNLRKDMKWSDGIPITSQDFVWTYDQAMKPENNYPYISIFTGIESYIADDEYTILVTLKDASCTGILTAGQITPLPKHVWENLSWSDPDKNPEILNPTVVSGPWRLKEWKRDEYATFIPNDLYFGGVPLLDSYTIRIVPDTNISYQMLMSGEVDYAQVSAANYKDATQNSILNLYSWIPAQPTWYYIGINFKQQLFQDIQLRHALSYAIPKQQIADKVFNGLAEPTYTTFSPSSWVYNSNVAKYDYNIDTAKQILDAAGYKLDKSAERLDLNNNPIKLKIYYTSTDRIREQIASIAQEEFSKLGIDTEIIGLESNSMFDFLTNNPDSWDMWIGLARDTSDPYFMYQAWSESTIPQINIGAYINKQVENLFTQGNIPPCDINRRRGIYQQIQQLISDDSPYIFLVYNTSYAFVNRRIEVNPPSILGINYQINQWYIRR
jgi:peptide/nickel transport system substrate-binding protein